jgi:hypothetical protein
MKKRLYKIKRSLGEILVGSLIGVILTSIDPLLGIFYILILIALWGFNRILDTES